MLWLHPTLSTEGGKASSPCHFRRCLAQVQELSAEASKEAALINQEVWEEAQGPTLPSQWYFNQEGAVREASGAVGGELPSCTGEPDAP